MQLVDCAVSEVQASLLSLHQLNETFLVELFNQDGSKLLIQEPSSVNLTIVENDDPHGVFSFAAEYLNVTIGELDYLYTMAAPVTPGSVLCALVLWSQSNYCLVCIYVYCTQHCTALCKSELLHV